MVLRLMLVAAICALPAVADDLQGRIITDDGNPVPVATVITLHCDDSAVATGIDSSGAFAFEGSSDSAGCSIRIEAPAYRPVEDSVETLPRDPGIPAFVLHRLARNQGESISVSHLAAPRESIGHYHAATRMMNRPQADMSAVLGHLAEAVQVYPGYAQAWFETGRLRLALGQPDKAIQAFQNAVNADPWFVSPYQPLILLLRAQGETAAADTACLGLRRINPELPEDCGT